jgi:hypothetical protein
MAKRMGGATEADFTETWEERKARRLREKAKPDSSPAPLGRPMVIPHGSEAERRLRSMWAAGTQIKTIAAELGVSEKAVKNARARLRLPTRRPDLGKGAVFRIHLDAETMRLLRAATTRRGSTKASYIRMLIHRDAGR